MFGQTRLSDVFGIRPNVNPRSYVDRGGLDEKLRYLLGAGRHVVVHGDSKQGKSWLRARLLNTDDVIVVQCQPGTDPEQIIRQALGALNIRCEIKRKTVGTYEGTMEFSGSGDLGVKILTKLGIAAKIAGKAARQNELESQPLGQTPADLGWVSRVLLASEKTLVVEDFHYVSEENRREAAYLFKALGDYGVFPVVIGVWPTDHLLAYYNGDLEGRVEDIHLTWSDADLDQVLKVGNRELAISMTESLRRTLVLDAYNNVGLLQRLAESLCREEGIFGKRSDAPFLTPGASLDRARLAVAESMGGRFELFIDSFVRGLRRLNQGLEIYKHVLRAVSEADDADLRPGLAQADLLDRVNSTAPAPIRSADLTQALHRIDRLQSKIGVKPVVLMYNRASRRLFVVDQSFLFYRRFSGTEWPWLATDFDPTNDLAANDPLDLES
ncbi:hypothetical protein AB0K00_21715 [Dactylosporangium sp. NPDC049525]|uniref:hypothetical protein n=1 Tax=Dactylosporangium sp. NPDC049525 TaxID=3154730 RepID=UPI00343567F2